MLNDKSVQTIVGAVIGVTLAVGIWFYFKPATAPASNLPATLAVKSPVVSKATKVDVVIKKSTVKAYKPSVKKDLQLPATVQTDVTKVVTESSLVASSEQRTEVTTVLDTQSGETVAYVHLVPDPWFATESRGNLSLSYGIKLHDNSFVWRISAHEDVFQIKSIHFGVNATVDTDGAVFAGAGASYRW